MDPHKQRSQLGRMRDLISTAVSNMNPEDIAEAAAKGRGDGIVSLDPAKCRMNDQHRRLQRSIDGPELDALVESIKAIGQIQEAKGWRLASPEADGTEVVLIYGARRRAAAERVGIKLRVRLVPEPSPRDIARDMYAENKGRLDYSPYERGLEFLSAIEQGNYASQVELAEAWGEDRSTIVRCVQIAQLPREIVEAYVSPGHIPLRDGAKLAGLIEGGAAARARAIAAAEKWRTENRKGDPTAALLAAAEQRSAGGGQGAAKPVNLAHGRKAFGRISGHDSADGAINLLLRPDCPAQVKEDIVAILTKHFPGAFGG